MKKSQLIFMFLFPLILCSSCIKTQPKLEEKLLDTFAQCIQGIESNLSYERVNELVDKAKAQLDVYQKNEKINECFLREIIKCHSSYLVHQQVWKIKKQAKTKSRQEDMQKTMFLSREFALNSLDQAKKCLTE